jgi:hypothetical protein
MFSGKAFRNALSLVYHKKNALLAIEKLPIVAKQLSNSTVN